jgi:hypothetical protein
MRDWRLGSRGFLVLPTGDLEDIICICIRWSFYTHMDFFGLCISHVLNE